jgi:hypothetical protein
MEGKPLVHKFELKGLLFVLPSANGLTLYPLAGVIVQTCLPLFVQEEVFPVDKIVLPPDDMFEKLTVALVHTLAAGEMLIAALGLVET